MKISLTIVVFWAMLFCSIIELPAQSNGFTVKAVVQDSIKAMVLEGATVRLLKLPDSFLVAQGRTTKDGFSFAGVAAGHYLLSVSFIGYATRFYMLQANGKNKVMHLPPLNLQAVSTTLAEVVVRASTPIVARGDTLAYNAEAFKTQPNASVEDLLKKLPGVEVDDKGQVTVNGQHVDKFYIDGKEIPVTDARALTQSITADMLSGVETFDRQSNESKFSGIKDRDPAKAINLKIKKAYQQSVNGRAFAGIGDGGHYAIGANSFLLLPDTKLQLSVNRNNSNDILGMGGIRQNYAPWGIVSKTNVNLQGNTKFSPTLTVLGAYNYNETQSHNENNGERQTFLMDSTLLSRSSSASENTSRGHQFNAEILWRPDSMTEMSIKPQFRINHTESQTLDSQLVDVQKTGSRYTATQAGTKNKSVTDNSDKGGEISLRHRFYRRGETAGMRVAWSGQSATTTRQFLSDALLFDSTGMQAGNTKLDQRSYVSTPGRTISAGVNYTYPVKPNLIVDASYDYTNTRQRSNKMTYNFNPVSGQYDLPDSLTTNQFMNTMETQRIGVGLNNNKKGFNYQLGAAMQYSAQRNDNYKGPGANFSQKLVNWFPRAMLSYAISPRQQFFMNYSGSSIQPTIFQLQPLPDFSNPLLIRKGNPDLAPEFDHNVNINYQRFSKDRLQNFLFNISGFLAQRKLTQASNTLAGGVQEMQFVNTDGTRSVNLGANYNHSLGKGKKGNIRAGTNIRYSRLPGFVNTVANTRESVAIEPSLGFNYTPVDKLLLEGTSRWAFSHTNYSFSGASLQQRNQYYTMGFSLELPHNFYTASDYSLVVTGAQGSLPGQSVGIWNANLAKRLFRKKTGELRISAFDILKGNKGYFQTLGENYIASRTSFVLTRTFFISFVYHFKAQLGK